MITRSASDGGRWKAGGRIEEEREMEGYPDIDKSIYRDIEGEMKKKKQNSDNEGKTPGYRQIEISGYRKEERKQQINREKPIYRQIEISKGNRDIERSRNRYIERSKPGKEQIKNNKQ